MRGKRCSWRDVRVWLKEHDWKSCIRQKRIWGSNPHLSASDFSKAPVWALSFSPAPLVADTYFGRVAERLNAAVSKTVLPVTRVTRVRIPPPPPVSNESPSDGAFFVFGRAAGIRTREGRTAQWAVLGRRGASPQALRIRVSEYADIPPPPPV